MSNLLEASNLTTTFPLEDGERNTAVNKISLFLKRGEIVGLVGESGSGKSVTAMSMLQLILSPGVVTGEVYYDGVTGNLLDYAQNSDEVRAVRGGKVGFIFQEPMTSLNPVLTVGFQICENIKTHLGLNDAEAKERAIDIMRQVGIANPEVRFGQYPTEFSGGMRQRIMIAMVLSAEPEVLVADEATTALDVTTQAQILELIQNLSKERNLAVIIVTHNLGLVARYTDRIYVMYGGNIVETADKYELFEKPNHPYTKGLLAAVPRLNDPKDRMLIPIEGMPPSPGPATPYCRFYDRCPYRLDKCKTEECKLENRGDEHFVRCLLSYEEVLKKEEELGSTSAKRPIHVPAEETCLKVDQLKMYFPLYRGIMKRKVGDVRAVEDVSFEVKVGETLGVVGESGCGKTTLGKCIVQAITPTGGHIYYKGTDINSLKGAERHAVKQKITMIFQDPFSSLDPRQTAESIVGEPLRVNKLVKSRAEFDARVDELFNLCGLNTEFRTRVPREFSGGQRQRLGIARALASEPDVIVCDEPVSALDVSIQAQIINLLEELQSKLGITYVFIAHDLSVVKHICDRIVVMYLGRIVETGNAASLCDDPMHPYTKALLSAVPISDPKAEESRERIKLIGEVPSVLERPSGCPFSARCQYASARCHAEIPELKDMGDGRQVACFLFDK